MSNESQNTDNQIKIEQIISAAQNIFGRYGMKKSTMNEIASELGISKASLYYYFPDKEHLYKTVVEKEHHEFITDLTNRLAKMDNVDAMIWEFVNIRLQYFRSLLNLSRFRMEDFSGMKTIMENVWISFRNKEIEVIQGILNKGKEEKLYYFDDVNELSDIFLELLKGLSHIMIKRKQIFYLEQTEYEILIKKAGMFTDNFIRGLKYN
jgi:AcrR family transcriptional regulator